jgi:hypothetical protein
MTVTEASSGFCWYWIPKVGPRDGIVPGVVVPCCLSASARREIMGRDVHACDQHRPLLDAGIDPSAQEI